MTNYLKVSIRELGDECGRVLELIHQLQLPRLQDSQKANILAELIASAVHLNSHCSEDFQDALSDKLEKLPINDFITWTIEDFYLKG